MERTIKMKKTNKKLFIIQIIGLFLILVLAVVCGIFARADAVAFRNNITAMGSEYLVPPAIVFLGCFVLYKITEKMTVDDNEEGK